MRARCRYLDEPAEAFIIDDAGMRPATSDTAPKLCSWAHDAPEALAKLFDVPIWIQRNAGSGAYLNYPADCETCSAYVDATPA
jgi:hypothetical protein